MKRSRVERKEERERKREREREREMHKNEKKRRRKKEIETKEREVLSRSQQINERMPERRGEQGGKRDCVKVTKVHFIEFWVAVLPGARTYLTS